MNSTTHSLDTHHLRQNFIIAKGDSGATDHYIREEDKSILHNIHQSYSTAIVQPDGAILNADKRGFLNLPPELSEEALQATIVPSLKSTSLISLGKLCDDGCEVKLNSKTLQATKNNKIVVTGIRNHQDGLWDIPVWKEKLQDNHFVAPKAHGGMYAMKVNRRRWIPPPKPPDSPVKTTSSNKWMHGFDELIEDNKWDTSIKYQMREDRRECLNVIYYTEG